MEQDRIGRQLGLAFVLMALLILGSGGVVWFRMMGNEDRVAAELGSAAAPVVDAMRSTRGMMLGLVMFVVLTLAGLAVAIIRRLRGQLGGEPAYARMVAAQIAAGDLASEVRVRDGDRQSVVWAIGKMRDDLRTVVAEVVSVARQVADSSGQIAHGNLELSQRTEMQATTLEETASSMHELTSTVTQNADNAGRASQLAVEASEVAREGGQVVGQVVSTMNGISDSSRRIADIIGVIDGIAFQTNILALNAAVEAARAGDQGRGFAVVAAEVRNLAQRSAGAAREIKALIGESVDKVDAGAKLVDSAGRKMDEIVLSVRKVSDLIAEIAAASVEQSSGIQQVSAAVSQMEQVVQQNAALVEEGGAATEALKQQAAGLVALVGRFRVEQARGFELQRGAVELAASPAPIRTIPPAAPAPVLGVARRAPQPAEGRSGSWQEF
jgi:methyl-accepting chemotaxis protein